MECVRCGRGARTGAKFCDGCGLRLAGGCSACGHDLRADARFCDACGTSAGAAPVEASLPAAPSTVASTSYAGPDRRTGRGPLGSSATTPRRRSEDLLAPPAADPPAAPRRRSSDRDPSARGATRPGDPRVGLPEVAQELVATVEHPPGERKQVTVLFADVEGSMELAEQLDDERWRDIMNGVYNIFCGVVERYEGTVHQFVGDGAIAYFGAPVAHEDHARRACVAAMDLLDELKVFGRHLSDDEDLEFHVRMGLNSGDVVVGAVGEDDNSEYVAIGHTVGLAQRMEALAASDTAVVSENTAALVRGKVRLRDRGTFDVKGARAPLRVHELVSVRGHRDDDQRILPLVGRHLELSLLDAALQRAAGGNGQVVAIQGDAGIGKHRLVGEFSARARELGLETISVEALAHERNVPLLTLQTLLLAFFRVEASTSVEERRERIGAAFAVLDPAATEELPILLELLGVGERRAEGEPGPPVASRRRVARMLGRLLRARTQEEPLLVVVQNLQWLDPASRERMVDLVSAVAGSHVLLVMTHRPEHQVAWPAEVNTMRLGPLTPDEQRRLLGVMLGEDTSVDELAGRVAARAAGNPLFLVEMVRSLADGGTLAGEPGQYVLSGTLEDGAIPPTVEALIAARIDRLPDRQKAVLQAAAVVGEEFADEVLRRVCDLQPAELEDALEALEAGDLLRAIDTGHAFRQTVVQEVAYRQQLERRRRALHAAAAAALADADGELEQEHLALIAAHAERAGDLVPAAEWHAQAARAAVDEPVREIEHWRHVRRLLRDEQASDEWLDRLGLSACVRLLTLERGRSEPSGEAAELHRDAHALAARTGAAGELVAALVGQSLEQVALGELETALALGAEALDAAQRAGDAEAEAVASWIAVPLAASGRLEEAHRQLSRAVQLAETRPTLGRGVMVESQLAWAHQHRAWVNAQMGNLGAARADGELAVALAVRQGDQYVELLAHGMLGTVEALGGDPLAALERFERALELADTLEDPPRLLDLRVDHAVALIACGRGEEGRAVLAEVRTRLEDLPPANPPAVAALTAMAASCLLEGRLADAVAAGRDAVAAARRCGASLYEIPATLALGHALAAEAAEGRAEPGAAREAVDRGLLLVRATRAGAHAPALHALSATVAELESEPELANRARAARDEALAGTRLVARPPWRPAPRDSAPPPGHTRDVAA